MEASNEYVGCVITAEEYLQDPDNLRKKVVGSMRKDGLAKKLFPDLQITNKTENMEYTNILELADSIVNRREDSDRKYPDPVDAHKAIAEMFNIATGHNVSGSEVALMQILLKVGRQAFHHKTDNLVDICGYAQIVEMIESAKK
jgi:hypothetical protein